MQRQLIALGAMFLLSIGVESLAQELPKEQSKMCESSRPQPLAFEEIRKISGGAKAERFRLSASIFGHGKVRAELLLRGDGEKPAKAVWSGTLFLQPEGSIAKVEREFDLPRGASWTFAAYNVGAFSGYCTTAEAKEKLRAEIEELRNRQAVADDPADVSVSGPGYWH